MNPQQPSYGMPYDPTAQTLVTPHVTPQVAADRQRGHGLYASLSVLAILLALGVAGWVALRPPTTANPAQITSLQREVTSLQQQHSVDVARLNGLTTEYAALNTQYQALSKRLDGVAAVATPLAPYTKNQCSTPIQGQQGPVTASFPCTLP